MKYIFVLISALIFNCSSEDKSIKTGERPSSKVLQAKDTKVLTDSKENYASKSFNFSYKPVYSPININNLSPVETKKLYSDLLIQDQRYRDSLHVPGKNEKQIRHYWNDIKRADSINQLILSALIHKFGWPSVNTYGRESVEAAFLITWHSDIEFMKQHLFLFEVGSKVDSLNFHYFKITKDLVLLKEGKEQLYNTHKRLANGSYQIDF